MRMGVWFVVLGFVVMNWVSGGFKGFAFVGHFLIPNVIVHVFGGGSNSESLLLSRTKAMILSMT